MALPAFLSNLRIATIFTYIGFVCSCGLYEFGGIFWMTYFNPFVQKFIGLSSSDIGTIVLVAQISDALANPTVGLLIESINIPYLGNKKGCHLIGSILVILFFPLMWIVCPFCTANAQRVIYYSAVAGFLNAVTPLMFLPHLSMIAVLGKSEKQRYFLGGLSSFSKQFWGILAYATMWLLIGTDGDSDEADDSGTELAEQLKLASYVVVGVGVVCTVIFHASVWRVKDTPKDPPAAIEDVKSKSTTLAEIKKAARSPNFYMLGLLYFMCRSELILYNFYQYFYYTQSLNLHKEAVAYLPFICLTVGGLGSIAVKQIVKRITPIGTFLLGMFLVIASGVAFMVLPSSYENAVIIPVITWSLGSILMYTLSLSFATNLLVLLKISDVGLWGVYNFIDRILFGLLFVILQNFRPCPDSKECCEECAGFYRYAFGGGFAVLALIAGVLALGNHFTNSSAAETETAKEEMTRNQVVPEATVA